MSSSIRHPKSASRLPWEIVPILILSFAATAAAGSGDLESLTQQLETESDFKVRLSAALKLGKLGNHAAVPALTDALGDSHASVRAIAASAIANIVCREVPAKERRLTMAALAKVAQQDPESRTRKAAQSAIKALEYLEQVDRPRKPKGGVYLDIAPIRDSSGQLDAATLATLTKTGKEALLAATDSILVEWPGGKAPSKQALKKAGVRASFAIIGTITQMDVRESGKRAVVECKLSLIQASYPDRAARAFIDGKAKLEASSSDSAVKAAKNRCAMNIVQHLMGKRLVADLTAAQ